MRNTKIALAVLALVASTAAMADGAQVYGLIDMSMTSQTNQGTQMHHSTWGTSVWGIQGSEDLDGGMKASYQLEGGLNNTNGTTNNPGIIEGLFNRQSNIALSGEFGSVKLGTQLSPFIGAALGSFVTDNASYYVPVLAMASATSPAAYNVTGTSTATGGFFIPSSISYSSPSIGGFSASALVQANSQSTTPIGSNPNVEGYRAFSTSFTAGDVSVSAGYEKNPAAGAALSGDFTAGGVIASGKATQSYTAGSTYTMGALKVGAGYIKTDFGFGGAGTNTYLLGAAYNVNEKLVVNLNYATANNANSSLFAGATNTTTTKSQSIINLGAKYSLSKRTYAYGSVSRGTNGAGVIYAIANTGTSGDSTGYAIGLGHAF